MITCATCGRQNVEGARFCTQCGAPLAPQPGAWRIDTDDVTIVNKPETKTNEPKREETFFGESSPYVPPVPPPHAPPATQNWNTDFANDYSPPPVSGMPATTFSLAVISLCVMLVGLIPCLGSLNYITIIASIAAIITGIIALNGEKNQKAINKAVIGIVIAAIALVLGSIRLLLGGCVL